MEVGIDESGAWIKLNFDDSYNSLRTV